MKRILSVSLGSPSRDHGVTMNISGETVEISRRGANGSLSRALEMYTEFDGKIDAFGVGGIEFYLLVGGRRYYWREAKSIRKAICKSKVGDGNGVRTILGRRTIVALENRLNRDGKTLRGMKVLQTAAVGFYFMAEQLVEAGCKVTFGDFLFTLGLPIPVYSLVTVRTLAALILPVVNQAPYRWLYTLGEEQNTTPRPRWSHYYNSAEMIAGDYLQIRSYMPESLRGKIILTNTTTARDVEDLRSRGVYILATMTPRMNGRSFGTNVIEAVLLALLNKRQADITRADFEQLIDGIPFLPNIEVLNPL